MRRVRQLPNRWNQERGTWSRKFMDTSPEALATAPPLPPTPAPIGRIHHPAITAPAHKCYRVIRRFLVNGGLQFEDIGAVRTFGEALTISIREQGYAVVLDPNGKHRSYNGQPVETRL